MARKNSKAEILLYIILITCAASLIAVNLFFPSYLSADEVSFSENKVTPLKNSVLYRSKYMIKLSVSAYDKCTVLINGASCGVPYDEYGYLSLEVYDGDVIHLDLREARGESVSVFVEDVSEGITSPVKGSKIFAEGGIVKIFTVESGED